MQNNFPVFRPKFGRLSAVELRMLAFLNPVTRCGQAKRPVKNRRLLEKTGQFMSIIGVQTNAILTHSAKKVRIIGVKLDKNPIFSKFVGGLF